jgi:hypothetical protein
MCGHDDLCSVRNASICFYSSIPSLALSGPPRPPLPRHTAWFVVCRYNSHGSFVNRVIRRARTVETCYLLHFSQGAISMSMSRLIRRSLEVL